MAGGVKSFLAPWLGGAGAEPVAVNGGIRSFLAPWMGGAASAATVTDGCFFGGEFFDGNFYCGGATPVSATALAPAGRSTRERKKRKVVIGDRLYLVESLDDVEFLLKRLVREESEQVVPAAKARVRVIDRLKVKPEAQDEIQLPIASAEVDWSALWTQLAMQDAEYARALVKIIARQEEDDIESILLMLH